MKLIQLLLVLAISCFSANTFADDFDNFKSMRDRYFKIESSMPDYDTFCNYAKGYSAMAQTIKPIFEKRFEEVLYPHSYNQFRFYHKIDVAAQEYHQLMCNNSDLSLDSSTALSYKEAEVTLRAIETPLFNAISEDDINYFQELSDSDYSKRMETFLRIATLKQKTFEALRSTNNNTLCFADKHISITRFFLAQTDVPYFVESDKVFIKDTAYLYQKTHPIIKAACKGTDITEELKTNFTDARDAYIEKYPQSAEALMMAHYADVNAQFKTSYSLVIGYKYPTSDHDKNDKKKKKK